MLVEAPAGGVGSVSAEVTAARGVTVLRGPPPGTTEEPDTLTRAVLTEA